MKGIGYKDSDVVILSPSPILSRFVADSVSCLGLSSVSFSSHDAVPQRLSQVRMVFVDFMSHTSIASVAHTFPAAKIAVLSGVTYLQDIERQCDEYPFFSFIEKPFSASEIHSLLSLTIRRG